MPPLPKPGSPFTQHRKLDRLRTLLEHCPAGLPLADLATALRISPRSVRRYLQELHRAVSLESLPTAPGGPHVWRIKPNERNRAIVLRKVQAYILLATRPLFAAFEGSTLYEEITLAWQKLLTVAHRPTRPGLKADIPTTNLLEERLVYLPSVHTKIPLPHEVLDILFQAVAYLHPVCFSVSSPAGPVAHRVNPYALVLHQGELHCLGYDTKAYTVSPFPLRTIQDLLLMEDETFLLPEGFTVTPYLQGEFGLSAQKPLQHVLLEFDAQSGRQFHTRKVHPSQKIATARDGRVRLSLTVPDLKAMVPWVLRFGPSVRVLEPETLVTQITQALIAALRLYKR